MAARDGIEFLLDGERVVVHGADPTRTVLQYLREDLGRTGTKEGCAEGDCGACTVVLAEPDASDGLAYRAVNACIQFLPTLHGKELITVESLSAPGAPLHPVQQALVDCHGSQCGFCTPGFVMSLFALYKSRCRPTRREVDEALAGNLCRCTGYRPIVAAAQRMHDYGAAQGAGARDRLRRPFGVRDDAGEDARTRTALAALGRDRDVRLEHAGRRYLAPVTLASLAEAVQAHPDACLLAGGTDVGLWVTKELRELDTVIYLGNVAGLDRIEETDGHLEIGAAVTLTDAMEHFARHWRGLHELFVRFASPPIRNAATLCGNVANGSPIGDCMPALLALDASVVLRKGDGLREVSLDAFYPAYRETVMRPGEFIERVRVPLGREDDCVRGYKLSKRFDQDISAVCAAVALRLEGQRVADVRIGFGGMAATPVRARRCEDALRDAHWDETAIEAGARALEDDFEPIGDMRASAGYRRRAAANLLRRFYLDSRGELPATSVYDWAR